MTVIGSSVQIFFKVSATALILMQNQQRVLEKKREHLQRCAVHRRVKAEFV